MKTVIAGLILSGLSASVSAATITLTPPVSNAGIGETVTVEMFMDFTGTPTLGGGVDLFFDAAGLQFLTWTPENLGDPTFLATPQVLPGQLDGIGFGDFGGLTGPAKVGTATFQALSAGAWDLNLAGTDSLVGPFVSATTFGVQSVQFGSASVQVAALAAPVPPALWLFGSALAAFTIIGRRGNA